jgi:hypothetical protein
MAEKVIKDGKGRGYEARVNNAGQLSVSGAGLTRDSAVVGKSYIWRTADADIDAGDTMLMVRNESEHPLAIDKVIIQGGNVQGNYTVQVVTVPFTATGTANTPVNVNYADGAPKIPPATAMSDETQNGGGDVLYEPEVDTTTTYELDTTGLILGQGVAVIVDQEVESTAGRCSIHGHYLY